MGTKQVLEQSAFGGESAQAVFDGARLVSDGVLQRQAAQTYPRWLKVQDAARYASLSAKVLRSAIHRGELPASQVGQRTSGFRIDRLRLDAWLESRTVKVHVPNLRRRVQ